MPDVISALRSRVRVWRYRRSAVRLRKARLRARIARNHRVHLQTIYPDRETLPLSVWCREFGRHCWDSLALRYYPVALLRRRVERQESGGASRR